MKCPSCRKDEDKVIDSRTSEDGFAIRRRRQCTICKRRYTTYERIEGTTVKIAGGEDLDAFRNRAVSAINGIIESTDGDVLVVAHGGVICSYLTHVLNMDLDDLWSFSLPNASITTLVRDFRMRLRSFGDTAHLEGDAKGLDGMPSSG